MGEFNYVPLYVQGISEIVDGLEIKTPEFCKRNCEENEKCRKHYEQLLQKDDGIYVCPYGFTSRIFSDEDENRYIFTAMRIANIYAPKLADPKVKSSLQGCNYRRVTGRETDTYIKLFLDYKKKTESYDELLEFVEDIFHDIRRFNGQLKSKSNQLYNKANSKTKYGQFADMAQSIQALCAFTTLRLNAYDFIYNEVPLASTQKVSYNVFQMFDKVRHCLKARAEERGIRIEISSNGQCGDIKAYDCIELLPYILLDNGIKYSTEKSTIRVSITDSVQECNFKVISQSLPLLEGEEKKIFIRGYRGERARELTKEGLGIGLYTAKKICEVHNASIKVRQEYEKDKKVNNFIVEVRVLKEYNN